jgi:NAD(P)H-dependent FMN reductase
VGGPVSKYHALLISGSLRAASANTAILKTTIDVAGEPVTAEPLAGQAIECHLYGRLAHLPAFNPDADRDPLDPEVERLRTSIHAADGILFSTPEYAGALPGSLKNLLDWTIGDEKPGSIYNKPIGWINTSTRGAAAAYRELRAVLGYAHASIVEGACVPLPITETMIGADGLIEDATVRRVLADVLAELRAAWTVTREDGARPPQVSEGWQRRLRGSTRSPGG